jgi:DNA polymerase-3 subunit epsilon
MREIVFDTETTGLDCLAGDRLIEIGCVELLNHIPTGRTFHRYINPRRPVAYEAGLVHGLTDEFLRQQPGFEEIVDPFFEFVGDSQLVAHNAGFDRGFVNMELGLCGRAPLAEHRFVDTLVLARRRHPTPRTVWTRSAPATQSTRARAASTALFSTRAFWRKSTSS